jgi:hypothetical protein
MSVMSTLDSSSITTEDPSHPSSHIVKKELFDTDVMKSLLSDERFAAVDRALLKKYYKGRKGPNETTVVYNFGRGYELSQLGRIYPDRGMGLANFSRDIRNPLAAKHYWDIDIENAHYVIALHLAKERGLQHATIQHYVEHRAECLESVSNNRSIAKVAFLKILYGGDISLYDAGDSAVQDPEGDLSFLHTLKLEVDVLMDSLWAERDDIRKHCLRKRNPRASVMSIVLQTHERAVLMALDRYLLGAGRSLDVLIHDGGYVRRLEGETAFPIELLRAGEEFILKETGFCVTLAQKAISHTYDVKAEVLYICEGVTMDEFRVRKLEFERNHFYLRDNGSVCEVRADGTVLMMTNEHAMRNFANVVFEFRRENVLRRVPFFPLWLSATDRREYVRLVFRPDGNVLEGEYNTFLPLRGGEFCGSGGEAGLARFLEISLVLARGNVEHRDYILKWIALKIQKPWVIPGVCLVFTGPQGIGKSMLWEFVGRCLIGTEQFIYSDNIERDIFDKYSEAQLSKLFCLLDETSAGITRKLANELKAKITARMARINPKDVRPFSIDTFMSWVLLTNDSSPVKLESGDRRYCIFYTGSEHKGDFAYWSESAALFALDEVAGAVYAYLTGLDLSDFVVNAFPVTELRTIMMEGEVPGEESFLRDTARDMSGAEWRGTNQEFYKLYVNWCRVYDIKPKSAVGFGRDITPYILKGWIEKWGSNGFYGKLLNFNKIKNSER